MMNNFQCLQSCKTKTTMRTIPITSRTEADSCYELHLSHAFSAGL
jgi:hypothetical protein